MQRLRGRLVADTLEQGVQADVFFKRNGSVRAVDQKVCDLARAFSAAFVERAVDDNARADAQALKPKKEEK